MCQFAQYFCEGFPLSGKIGCCDSVRKGRFLRFNLIGYQKLMVYLIYKDQALLDMIFR